MSLTLAPWPRSRRIAVSRAALTPLGLARLGLFTAYIAVLATLIVTMTVQVPLMDEWELADTVQLALSGTLRPADLWASHGEHMLLVPRIYNLILILLTGWDRQLIMLCNLGVAIGGLGLLLAAVRATCGKHVAWLPLLVTPLFLSFAQYENWLAPFQSAFILTSFGACCCTWAFSAPEVSRARFALAVIGALIASYASAMGVVLWIAFLPAVWASGKRRLAYWLPFFALVALSLAVAQQGVQARYERTIVPTRLIGYVFEYLGMSVAFFPGPVAGAFGLLSCVPVLIALQACWRSGLLAHAARCWFGLLAFAAGCALLTGLGRSYLASRYLSFSALWWIAALALVAIALDRGLWPVPSRSNSRRLVRLATALALGSFIGTNLLGVALAVDAQRMERHTEGCVLDYANADNACLSRFYPAPDVLRLRASYLAQAQIGPFRSVADAGGARGLPAARGLPDFSQLTLASRDTRATIAWCHVLVANPHQEPVVVPPGSALVLGGWAADDVAAGEAAGVLILIDDTPVALAEYGSDVTAVQSSQGKPPLPGTRYRAAIPAGTVAPGLHTVSIRVLAADGQHYYAPAQRVVVELR